MTGQEALVKTRKGKPPICCNINYIVLIVVTILIFSKS